MAAADVLIERLIDRVWMSSLTALSDKVRELV